MIPILLLWNGPISVITSLPLFPRSAAKYSVLVGFQKLLSRQEQTEPIHGSGHLY